MDSKTLVLLLLFCLMFLQDASDITHAHAQVHEPTTRKMLKMMKEGKWGGVNREEEDKSRGLGLNDELRTSPSGPDPLHHHVNPPRQPRNYFHLP